MLSDTAWSYAKLRITFPYGGSTDVCQHGLTSETGNYCLSGGLYMYCFAPGPRHSEGSFQIVVTSGCRL